MQKVRKCEASVKACRACSDEGQRDRQNQLLASASECEMVNFGAPISLSPSHFYLWSQLYIEKKINHYRNEQNKKHNSLKIDIKSAKPRRKWKQKSQGYENPTAYICFHFEVLQPLKCRNPNRGEAFWHQFKGCWS